MSADKQLTLDTSKWRYATIADKDNPEIQYWDFSRLEWADVADRDFEFSKVMFYRVPVEPSHSGVDSAEQPEQQPKFCFDITPKQAMDALRRAMQKDSDYAWSWHCNVAMAAFDAGAPLREANERAADFMRNAFDVDVRASDEWKNMPMDDAAKPAVSQLPEADSRYHEVKRLAEIAWAAILPVSGTPGEHIIAGWAWQAAEAMHAESEKRRPK